MLRFFPVALVLLLPILGQAADLQVRVVGVHDGDSITFLVGHLELKVTSAEKWFASLPGPERLAVASRDGELRALLTGAERALLARATARK